tara:strand:- start:116 stop:265 length:150 start_codon:yes stop_codon:yes gene_type:complete
MGPTSLSHKIDQAAKDYWKTLDPKYKKEWYRLIKVFHILTKRHARNKRT